MPGCKPGDMAVIIGPLDDPFIIDNVGTFVNVCHKTTPPAPHGEGILCFHITTKSGKATLKGVRLNNLDKMEVVQTDHIHYFPDKYLQPIRPPKEKEITDTSAPKIREELDALFDLLLETSIQAGTLKEIKFPKKRNT